MLPCERVISVAVLANRCYRSPITYGCQWSI